MDSIPRYLEAKRNQDRITYETEQLKPILAGTYGCIVYQEQVMQIVRSLAGYTMGRSDNVRRAMSKKKISVMEKEREVFIYGNQKEIMEARDKGEPQETWPKEVPGCIENGISEKVANGIYDEMIDFAKYAFNKSHAACYAVVAYQTAYLKHYYPVEFVAALITSVIDKPSKTAEYIMTARSMGIRILPPDINRGEADFAVEKKDNGELVIYYALTAIKGIGRNVIDAIVTERERNGRFESLQDLVERTSEFGVNKRVLENLIRAGACDGFDATRKQMMAVYLQILENVQSGKKSGMEGQMSLFDLVGGEEKKKYTMQMPKGIGEYEREELLAQEKEVLGLYVSGHPLESYSGLWDKVIDTRTGDFYYDEENGQTIVEDRATVSVGGLIEHSSVKYTRKNDAMAFLTLEDMVGTVEVVVFPKTYAKYKSLLREDEKILVKGRVSCEDEKDAKLIAEEIYAFSDIPRVLWLRFSGHGDWEQKRDRAYSIMESSDGRDVVKVYFEDTKKVESLPGGRSVLADEALIRSLKSFLGEENVRTTYRMPESEERTRMR